MGRTPPLHRHLEVGDTFEGHPVEIAGCTSVTRSSEAQLDQGAMARASSAADRSAPDQAMNRLKPAMWPSLVADGNVISRRRAEAVASKTDSRLGQFGGTGHALSVRLRRSPCLKWSGNLLGSLQGVTPTKKALLIQAVPQR